MLRLFAVGHKTRRRRMLVHQLGLRVNEEHQLRRREGENPNTYGGKKVE